MPAFGVAVNEEDRLARWIAAFDVVPHDGNYGAWCIDKMVHGLHRTQRFDLAIGIAFRISARHKNAPKLQNLHIIVAGKATQFWPASASVVDCGSSFVMQRRWERKSKGGYSES